MTDKPSRNEEEYFARQEAARLQAMRESAAESAQQEERRSHYMKCPKCGADLVTENQHGIQLDRCRECQGIWFDAAETEELLKQEGTGVVKILRSIMRSVAG